jgi:hypothetical protein
VKKLTLIVNEFRKINPDITANQMLVLLHAGAKPGIMQKELSAATDLADGTISRICALMSAPTATARRRSRIQGSMRRSRLGSLLT